MLGESIMKIHTLILISALSLHVALATGFKDEALDVTFPEKFDPLSYQGKEQYDQPGLGYSLRYQDEKLFKIDIYIYDKGLSGIGTGINSTPVKKEFESLLQLFPLMEERGTYKDVKQLKKEIISDESSGLKFRWSRFQYRQTSAEGTSYTGMRISETYLTAKSGQFIKVRLTLKKRDFELRKADITTFIRHFSEILNSHPTDQTSAGKGDLSMVLNESLTTEHPGVMGAWLVYGGSRLAWQNGKFKENFPNARRYQFTYEEELESRTAMATVWKELKGKDDTLKEPYLDDLIKVEENGFLKEYVWQINRSERWKKPTGLKLEEFKTWGRKNIPKHKPQTRVEIK